MRTITALLLALLPASLVGAQLAEGEILVEDVEIIEWHGAAEECPLFVARKAAIHCEGTAIECRYDDGEFVAHVRRAKAGLRFRYLIDVPTACIMIHERSR